MLTTRHGVKVLGRVSDLEAHLHVPLINRTTRRLSATEAGRRYFDISARVLDELDAIQAEMRDTMAEPTGKLRLSAPISFASMMMGPAIADMTGRYPKLALEVELSDRFVDLIEEGFDAAIRIRSSLPDSSLIAKRLCPVPRVVVAAPLYLRKHGSPREPNELKNHNCLIYTLSTRPREWRFKADGAWRNVRVGGSIEANNGQFLLAPLRCGLGIACLPEFLVADDLAAGRLKRCLSGYPVEDGSLYVVYPPSRQQTPKLRAFVDVMARHFHEPLTGSRGKAS